jgi:hypothetical protein
MRMVMDAQRWMTQSTARRLLASNSIEYTDGSERGRVTVSQADDEDDERVIHRRDVTRHDDHCEDRGPTPGLWIGSPIGCTRLTEGEEEGGAVEYQGSTDRLITNF